MSEELRRSIDALVPEINQKLTDFIERSDKASENHENRIAALEKSVGPVTQLATAIGWIVLTILTGALLLVGEKVAGVIEHWIHR